MRTGRGLMAFALVAGLAAAAVVFRLVSGNPAPEPAAPALATVWVATRTLPPQTVLTADMYRKAALPPDVVHPEAVQDPSRLEGRVVRSLIVTGEPILESRLYPAGVKPGLAAEIPPGMRAITIGVDEVVGVAGFVQPGTRVDVLATFDKVDGVGPVTIPIVQDVEVLAISQQTQPPESGTAKVATTVTLAVSLEQAQRITFADDRGRLRLALRGQTSRNVAVARPVTQDVVLSWRPARAEAAARIEPVRSEPVLDRGALRAEIQEAVAAALGRQAGPAGVAAAQPDKLPAGESGPTVEVIRGTRRELVTVPEAGK